MRKHSVFGVYERGNKSTYFYGKNGDDLLAVGTANKSEQIVGNIASTGNCETIKGEVRIVLDPQKDKFEKGKILVTSMTRVDFVPMMRIAKAIITNEGGLACHAPIVSRELGIPAIISTKNATHVLKNGQEVEMDLKTGTVKILK